MQTSPTYDIVFVDFGNTASVSWKFIRPIPSTLAVVPPQAQLATLSFTHVPVELDEDLEFLAMQRLAELTKNGSVVLKGFIDTKSKVPNSANNGAWGAKNSKNDLLYHLTLFDGKDTSNPLNSLNATLIKEGLAKVDECTNVGVIDPESLFTMQKLQQMEKIARQNHEGMWEYGDIDGNDDEGFPSL